MNTKFAIFILLVSLFFFCTPISANDWKELDSGLFYRSIELKPSSTDQIPSRIHVFKIDPKKYDLRPLMTKPNTRHTIKQWATNARALLAVNANFFNEQGTPLGLAIDQGKTLNPFKQISWWGVFYLMKSKPYIVHSSTFQIHPSITTAIQAGPRLVVNGSVLKLKDETSAKTAIGITKHKEVLLVCAQGLVSVVDLANLLARPENMGGLGAIDALNLDGGSSTQLYAKVGDFELNLPSFVEIPVGIGVFEK